MIDPKKFKAEDIPPEGKFDKEKDPRFNLRLVELWAQQSSGRKGWLKVQNI